MRRLLYAAGAVCLAAACQPNSQKTNPAVATDTNRAERQAAPPAAGASSFTMDQARERLEKAGFSDVTGLAQDANGVWRGSASRNGAQTAVSVDYQGNITPQ